jgi:two-component system, LytTR family, response regulator
MNTITCYIVDDELYAVQMLTEYVLKTSFLKLVGGTCNPIEAIGQIASHPVDLLFLDVQMPDMTGLQFAENIKGRNNAKIIFTTAYGKYALESYDYDAIDFLVKPIEYPRFLKAAQKAMDIISPSAKKIVVDEADHFFVKIEQRTRLQRINFRDIDYVESNKNYLYFYCGSKRVIALGTMKDLELELPVSNFMRIHNSYIVSLSKITGLEGNMVVLNGEKQLPIGLNYKQNFLDRIKIKK